MPNLFRKDFLFEHVKHKNTKRGAARAPKNTYLTTGIPEVYRDQFWRGTQTQFNPTGVEVLSWAEPGGSRLSARKCKVAGPLVGIPVLEQFQATGTDSSVCFSPPRSSHSALDISPPHCEGREAKPGRKPVPTKEGV